MTNKDIFLFVLFAKLILTSQQHVTEGLTFPFKIFMLHCQRFYLSKLYTVQQQSSGSHQSIDVTPSVIVLNG